jgi:beta-lactamase superfamily II metal-dependent hydrolase
LKLTSFIGVLFLSAISGALAGFFSEDPDRIIVLSVGQGDCAVVQSQGRAILIDVGPPEVGKKASLLAHLNQYGVTRLDAVLLSHPDLDHVGDLAEVHQGFPEAKVLAPVSFKKDSKLATQLQKAGLERVGWVNWSEGKIGRFTLLIRCPNYNDDGRGVDDNRGSMFVKVTEGDASYVTTGDAPSETEMSMEAFASWRAQVLHVGHHGSRFSTSLNWLKDVAPHIAVISCGLGNRYGHPHSAVLTRLADAGIRIARTDTMGDIELDVAHGQFKMRS